jgi:hypothetical protein
VEGALALKLSTIVFSKVFVVALALAGCGKGDGNAAASNAPRVRVQVPEAKCEVAIPETMTVTEASASGFWIIEKGKDKFSGMLIAITPVGAMDGVAPPGATDVAVQKDQKNPDGSVEREATYKGPNGQTMYMAEYIWPVGKDFAHCNINAKDAARRDSVAKLCSGLAVKGL